MPVTLEFLAGEDVDLVLEDVRKAVDDAKLICQPMLMSQR